MLTETDRAWLTDNKSFDGENARQQRYQRRESIRTGIEQTVRDFTVLVDHMDDKPELAGTIAEVFDLDIGSIRSRTDAEEALIQGLVDMIVFVFRVTTEELEVDKTWSHVAQPNDAPIGTGDYHSPGFLYVLYRALDRAYRDHNVLMDGITLEMEGRKLPDLDVILTQLEAGETLDPRVAAALLRSEAVDLERFSEFAKAELHTQSDP